jgi:hypothetical protein
VTEATLTAAERILAKIEAQIEADPLAESISLDGHSVSMPKAEAKRKQVDLEKGRLRRFQSIPLDRMGGRGRC